MKAFKCQHSGLLYPGDYVKQWGIKYGIGQGPEPRSEVLDTYYHLPQGEAYQAGSGVMMHPVGIKHAMLTEVDVSEEEYNKNAAILHADDMQMTERTKILITRQKAKKIQMANDNYAQARKDIT